MASNFADIILPLAIRGKFTYRIPEELLGKILPGLRVMVQFGEKKIYSGIAGKVHDVPPAVKNVKTILEILDPAPVVDEIQLKLWYWISDYYMCSVGEVMKAALPSAFCLEGEKSAPVEEKYKPKRELFARLASSFNDAELNTLLDKLARAPKQSEILIAYLRLSGYSGGGKIIPIGKSLLIKEADSTLAAFGALVRKGIFSVVLTEVGRLTREDTEPEPLKELSKAQAVAYASILDNFREKDAVLLHGVTSSGKTEIYIHLIDEQLRKGRQVLYLLPEISLTAQIIQRLRKHFSSVTGVFHSRFSEPEKVEIWEKVAGRYPGREYSLIIGARSALFLPFRNLGLVIVDEEQDGSLKQHDPAPRYNARDSAVVLSGFHNARVILGSASPSVETYNNALNGRYGLVELRERYDSEKLPVIILANTREAYRKKLMVSHFTPQLLEAIDEALANNEQVLLFQNRRGFAPYIECPECGWIPSCIHCAVNLTYHKAINRLVCHYCGYSTGLPSRCNSCNSPGLAARGFGTQKIEDEIKIVFPSARVARMDHDSTGKKNSFTKIIRAFEERQTDILVGTQMISKGLDFENLTVVGVMNADNLLNFPDFRAHERSFHMLEQISGRAGRRKKQGKVIIQTSDPSNRIIRLVLRHDYLNMFRMQMEERKAFKYPPFCRMIKISIKHKERTQLNSFAGILGEDLRLFFGKRVLGPEYPVISRIQQYYIKTLLIKVEPDKRLAIAKQYINEALTRLESKKGASSLKIAVDVDPY